MSIFIQWYHGQRIVQSHAPDTLSLVGYGGVLPFHRAKYTRAMIRQRIDTINAVAQLRRQCFHESTQFAKFLLSASNA